VSSLSLRAISKSFGPTAVLNDVSLEISSGEFFFILGPSGCGKSTLLRIIAGLERADTGSVLMDGRLLDEVPAHERGIGMVFQNYALWPHMTVAQNISFGLEVRRLSSQETRARVGEALELVRLAGFAHRYPHELSGGQQQRVALARALAIRPSIILLDEPLSNLDARLRDEIRQELSTLHTKLGVTMVYVTHDQEDALTLGSRIALLNRGRVEQEGPPRDLYERPTSVFAAQFLGDANLIPCEVQVRSGSGSVVARLRTSAPLSYDLPLNCSTPPASGPALVCVRPESLTLNRSGNTPFALVVDAEVRQLSYRGGWCDLVLEGPEGISLRMRRLSASKEEGAPQVGDRVQVGWNAEDTVLIPEGR
jgi:ABC-type Fe3+/spermidine/putrescine transport system ATPase subunit